MPDRDSVSRLQQGMRRRGALHAGESVPDAVARTVAELLTVDTALSGHADRLFGALVETLMADGVLALSTAPLANTGTPDAVTASCTVLALPTLGDEVDVPSLLAGSASALGEAIGTGYDLSAVSDPRRALGQLNDVLAPIDADQLARHRRRVASMATVRADHPRILDVVRAKRAAGPDWRVTLSVLVDEALFETAGAVPLRDGTGTVVGHLDAAELLDELAASSHECGEPGILFWDRFERDNPTPDWPYVSTAPCAEVAMPVGDACHFSYVNLARLVRGGQFDEDGLVTAVRALTRLLDASVELTARHGARVGLTLVPMKRRIGVGLTGYADLLIRLGLTYGGPESLLLAGRISELTDHHSKVESVRLARTRGPFPAWSLSRYTDPAWVRRKVRPGGGLGRAWDRLFADLADHGIRHACTTALPSAETSSALVGSSTSLEPLMSLTDATGRLRPPVAAALADHPPGTDLPYLRTATQIPYQDHLAVQAAFQSYLDDGISKTVNVPEDTTVADFRDAFGLARRLNLKGTSLYRSHSRRPA